MGTRVIDDDADPVKGAARGVHALAYSLRASERRRRVNGIVAYALLVVLVAIASTAIYLAQARQLVALNRAGYTQCVHDNAQL